MSFRLRNFKGESLNCMGILSLLYSSEEKVLLLWQYITLEEAEFVAVRVGLDNRETYCSNVDA